MAILELARKYNQFQHRVGNHLDNSFEQDIDALFSPSFHKTANSIPLVNQRTQLKEQLENVREVSGAWDIIEKELIPFQDAYRCLIRYRLVSKNFGSFEVMTILHMDEDNKIQSIDENYHQIIQ